MSETGLKEGTPETKNPPAPQTASAAKIYSVVLGVGVVCSLLIVTTYEVTRPIIKANKLAMREQAILDVIPGAVTSKSYQFDETDAHFHPATADAEESELIFAGYDEKDNLVGLAIEANAMGYQDTIRLLYGYSPEKQAIVGMSVLESRETPGLGDRIQTDPNFRANFEALDVSVNPSGDELAHPIEFVKEGEKQEPWQIDGITGATISSKATADMLRASTSEKIPLVKAKSDDFRSVPKPELVPDTEGEE
ncbi:Electron transport complex protein RnfG [Novipirellula aureliae]|uniref:Ion-translocating oxidoreductase complex subunit G n=1 Tax=Novipirellula aureliae TaxID=2527966 RepID=A0A5C6E6Z7_9BACT|nr:FMN-binding protein [Novipirellula aureliae]TWU43431.1 Electron transport complex protein RnfG [Novipirellula aureliae]